MTLIFLSIATFVSTLIGGYFSIKNQDKLHRIMAFTAGVILAVVFFDIFPEIYELVRENNFNFTSVMIALTLGFLFFHILEKSILIHHHHEDEYKEHKHPNVGIASALALIGHSFMDGVGIGLGFQVSNTVGFAVAIAVIAHDFTDGMNTVNLLLNNKNSNLKAKIFLVFDALAPVLGVLSTLFFTISSNFLVLYLGFFAGFLLYISASDILPEAHEKDSSYKTILLTILGMLFIFVISRFS
ncbi:MAG: ZIP family metal transporter [Candidatus Pacebacteria bacterium]|nr:ZIP family metal transporter [Candidatus Paceibacterota bacterium]